jgi:hypothetical protein
MGKKILKFKTTRLFYVSYFKFLYNYFLKFIVHKINSKMIKSRMVVLTERDKTDVDVAVYWMLYPTAEVLVDERKRENWCDVDDSEIQSDDQ